MQAAQRAGEEARARAHRSARDARYALLHEQLLNRVKCNVSSFVVCAVALGEIPRDVNALGIGQCALANKQEA